MRAWCEAKGLRCPPELLAVYESAGRPAAVLENLLYRPELPWDQPPSLDWAISVAEASPWPMPRNLVPLLPVDGSSFACAVATPVDRESVPGEGAVVRWHIGLEKPDHQAALLDTDPGLYVASVVEELAARGPGLTRMLDQIGPWYETSYLSKEKTPRDFVLRPVRLACQNAILGLAAFAQDSSFDGLTVLAWQTCELPHVATHEGNRALTALMLCDAYQSGGTMEIRFDRPAALTFAEGDEWAAVAGQRHVRYTGHPEMAVPASLRRYARTVNLVLGAEHPRDMGYISPAEARQLFLAVTPMPDELRERVNQAIKRGVASPERLCFTLLSGIWKEVELDYMLAVSDRAAEVLRGGTAWQHRAVRQAEAHVARAALMIWMLYRRAGSKDTAVSGRDARVLEDSRVGVRWSIVDELGVAVFDGLRSGRLPWQESSAAIPESGSLIVVAPPRPAAPHIRPGR